jgi:hypothetical protein
MHVTFFSFQGISGIRTMPIIRWQRHRQEIFYIVDAGDMNKQSVASYRPLSNRR